MKLLGKSCYFSKEFNQSSENELVLEHIFEDPRKVLIWMKRVKTIQYQDI